MKHAEMTTTQFKLNTGTAAILAALCGRDARDPMRYSRALRVAAISKRSPDEVKRNPGLAVG